MARFNEYVEATDFPFSFSVPGILAQHVAEVEWKSDAISAWNEYSILNQT